MLFDILDLPGETYGAVMQGTEYRALSGADFSVAVLAHWTSPRDRHRLSLTRGDSLSTATVYVVTPLIADQEFREPPPFETYWEGTCSVASHRARSSVRRTWS